jgi:hypothetical protein
LSVGAEAALQAVGYLSGDGVAKVSAAMQLVEEVVKPVQEALEALPVSKGNPVNDVVPLSAAKALYQRVLGTSPGSIYVVVGITDDAMVKVAARITNDNLSVRVEGSLSDKARERFLSQGLDYKKDYMSGHFQCNPKVNADRVIGAILMGTGLEFSTPLPSMEKVRKLCQ